MDLLGEDFSGLQVKILITITNLLKFPTAIGNKNVVIVHYYRRILCPPCMSYQSVSLVSQLMELQNNVT